MSATQRIKELDFLVARLEQDLLIEISIQGFVLEELPERYRNLLDAIYQFNQVVS